MKEVAKLQIKDRTELFQATAISMGMKENYCTINLEEISYFSNKNEPNLCGLWRFANAYYNVSKRGEYYERINEA